MDESRISNRSKPTKRRVRLAGRACAKSRAGGTLTAAPDRGRRAAFHDSRGDGGESPSSARETPASHRKRLSIRDPGPSSAVSSRLRACPADSSGCKHRVITLTQGKFAIVDDADYEKLSGHKWWAQKKGGNRFYAAGTAGGKLILMHREIMKPPEGLVCDHKNHNTLDNRRSNLRVCTVSQNQQNRLPSAGGTSRYKGVAWNEDHQKWQAQICHNGRKMHIGYYDYEADAAIAYDDKAVELFGEFACLNFSHCPEIRLWLEATYLFRPTRNDLAAVEAG